MRFVHTARRTDALAPSFMDDDCGFRELQASSRSWFTMKAQLDEHTISVMFPAVAAVMRNQL